MQEHVVPQQVTRYEFKILAGLTWKQFIVIGASGTLAYILQDLGRRQIISLPIAYSLALIAFISPLALIFIKIEGIPLWILLSRYFTYFSVPLMRVWRLATSNVTIAYPDRLKAKPKRFPTYLKLYLKPKFKLNTKQAILQMTSKGTASVVKVDDKFVSEHLDTSVKIPAIPNTLAIKLINHAGEPQPNVKVNLKNSNGKTIFVGETNRFGIVYFNEPLPSANYIVEINHPQLRYPTLVVPFTGKPYPLIKIEPNK